MENPFKIIDQRLSNIEILLIDIKHKILSGQRYEIDEKKEDDPFIIDADMSHRPFNVFKQNFTNYFDIPFESLRLSDVTKYSSLDLMKMRGFGRKSLLELKEILHKHGMELKR